MIVWWAFLFVSICHSVLELSPWEIAFDGCFVAVTMLRMARTPAAE